MKRDREAAAAKNTNRFGNAGGFAPPTSAADLCGGGGPSGADGRSPLKLCLLLRLGRADLAEVLFAAGTTWTPEVRGRDLTDYHISYLTLATDWAAAVFIRLVAAHMRGDDAIALDAARRLSAFAKAVETKADAMGFPRGQQPRQRRGPVVFPVPPPAPRAAGRSGAAGEGARAGADPEAWGRPLGADRRLDPRLRPDRRAADVVPGAANPGILRSCGR